MCIKYYCILTKHLHKCFEMCLDNNRTSKTFPLIKNAFPLSNSWPTFCIIPIGVTVFGKHSYPLSSYVSISDHQIFF